MNSTSQLFSPSKNKHLNTNHTKSPQKWQTSSRSRTPSSSSSSSFSSNNSSSSFRSEEFSLPNSPSTSFGIGRSGIPFSWETTPGIPKKQILLKKAESSSRRYLPLPPPVSTSVSSNKHYITRRDPFYAALVECSKGGDAGEDDNNNNKDVLGGGSIWKPCARSLSSRFGFVNMSCKNSSSSCVAESLVFLPTTSGPRRISYDVLKKRST